MRENILSQENKILTLKKIDAYKEPFLIDRLSYFYNLNRDLALDLFDSGKKMIFLENIASHKRREDHLNGKQDVKYIYQTRHTFMQDQVWHHWILMSEHYEKFCNTCFGEYVHHAPFSASYIDNSNLAAVQGKQYAINELTRMMQFVDEELGEKYLDKWYGHYPEIFESMFILNN